MADLAEDVRDVHGESANEQGVMRLAATGDGTLAAGGGAAWPASSSAVAHRRGPLPAAPMPRTRPQRTPRRNASVSAALRELVGPVVSRQVRLLPGERSQLTGAGTMLLWLSRV